jgi:hypothetical protein
MCYSKQSFLFLTREQRTCHFSKRIFCIEAFEKDHQHLSFSIGPSALLRQSSALVLLCMRSPALSIIEEDHQHLPLSMRSRALVNTPRYQHLSFSMGILSSKGIIRTCPSLWDQQSLSIIQVINTVALAFLYALSTSHYYKVISTCPSLWDPSTNQ